MPAPVQAGGIPKSEYKVLTQHIRYFEPLFRYKLHCNGGPASAVLIYVKPQPLMDSRSAALAAWLRAIC